MLEVEHSEMQSSTLEKMGLADLTIVLHLMTQFLLSVSISSVSIYCVSVWMKVSYSKGTHTLMNGLMIIVGKNRVKNGCENVTNGFISKKGRCLQ